MAAWGGCVQAVDRQAAERRHLSGRNQKSLTSGESPELSDTIDRIAAAIQTATKKEVLVIIDDLDKLDLSVGPRPS